MRQPAICGEVVELLVSPVHRYDGRPGAALPPAPADELVECIELRAGLGVVGDRYFGKRVHSDAALTVMAAESLAGLPPGTGLLQTRRNVLLRGVDVDTLTGSTFTVTGTDGAVRLRANRPARPCAWMDAVIAPGARTVLRDRGGVRCSVLSDGVLRVGPVEVVVVDD